ncbi:MAG: hypothetical protein AB1898_09965 [Acidobacteriota bacterium]
MQYRRLHSDLNEAIVEEMPDSWQVTLVVRTGPRSFEQTFAVLVEGRKPTLEKAKQAADRAIHQHHTCTDRCGHWEELSEGDQLRSPRAFGQP